MIKKILIINLSKSYNQNLIFHNVILTFQFGKVNIIHGKNGSGKTTLLNLIAGIDTDYIGSIKKDDEFITFHDCELYVQNNNLFTYLSVIDNLKSVCSDNEKIDKFLDKTSLTNLKFKLVSKLSKGEKQRVSLIKSLLTNKDILLLDEPFSNLDITNTKLFMDLFKEYAKDKIVIIASNSSIDELKKDTNVYYLPIKSNDIINNEYKKQKQKISFHPTNRIIFKKTIFYFIKKNFFNLALMNILSIIFILLINLTTPFYKDYTKNIYQTLYENKIQTFYCDKQLTTNRYRSIFTEIELSKNKFTYQICFSNNNKFKINNKLIELKDDEVILPLLFKTKYNIKLDDYVIFDFGKYKIKDFYDNNSIESNYYYNEIYQNNDAIDIYSLNYPIICSNVYYIENQKEKNLLCDINQFDKLKKIIDSYYLNDFKIAFIMHDKKDLSNDEIIIQINSIFIKQGIPQIINTSYDYQNTVENGINLNKFYKSYKIKNLIGKDNLDLNTINIYISDKLKTEIYNNAIDFGIGTNSNYLYFSSSIKDINLKYLSSVQFSGNMPLNIDTISYYYKNKHIILFLIISFQILEIIALYFINSSIKRRIQPIIEAMQLNKIYFTNRFKLFMTTLFFAIIPSIILSMILLIFIKQIKITNYFLIFINDFCFTIPSIILCILIIFIKINIISIYLSFLSNKTFLNNLRLDCKEM